MDSPVKSRYGWKEWILENEFEIERFDKSFTFQYTGNILKIDSFKDLSKLNWQRKLEQDASFYDFLSTGIDFEKMLSDGVDAIWLTEKGEKETRFTQPTLYGWDCESILIMNPEPIEEIKTFIKKISTRRALSF